MRGNGDPAAARAEEEGEVAQPYATAVAAACHGCAVHQTPDLLMFPVL